jgi:two-component system, cell cycle response regulator
MTQSATADSCGGAAPCRVLIVEDEGLVARDLTCELMRFGYDVVARAATGEEGTRQALFAKPDLILMDVSLKGSMDGIEAARQIREQLDVPIIYLTAFSDNTTLQRAMDTQPFGYVVKPFHPVELRCTIEVALNRHRTESAARDSEAQYRRLSTIDELTGLPNRRGFCELAEQQLKVARRFHQPLVLCFADLDGLKAINDTLGHAVGDDAIRAAAGVLKDTFRGADIVGRLSGDEFAVLAISTSAAGGDCALRRLSHNLAMFNAAERPYRLEMSMGMAHHDVDVDERLSDLLARADAAMYAQKNIKRSLTPRQVSVPPFSMPSVRLRSPGV